MKCTEEQILDIIMDKLSKNNPNHQYEVKDLVVERISNERAHHDFADNNNFSIYYKVTNKDKEQCIIEFKYRNYTRWDFIDAEIVLSFAKRDISIIENTVDHVLITTENGSGIYNLIKKRFDIEIGKISGINKAIRTRFWNSLSILMSDIHPFIISNSFQKKGLCVPNYESLNIPLQYDEIYYDKELSLSLFSGENFMNIFVVKQGGKLGLYIYRYLPADEKVLYNEYYAIADDDAYYNKMLLTIIPANYDKIELFHENGTLKLSENGKVGLYDINSQKIIIPTMFDEIEEFHSLTYTSFFKAKIDEEQYLLIYMDTILGQKCEMYKIGESQYLDIKEPPKARKLVNIGAKLPRYPD